MGSAMLNGWIQAGIFAPDAVVVTDKDSDKAASLAKEFSVNYLDDNARAASGAKTVVLAVKPQDSVVVLEEISSVLSGDTAVLSIIAGLSIASMRARLGQAPSIVRVMPNMGAQVGASVSGYAVEPGEGYFDAGLPRKLLESIGQAVEVDESAIDLVTAVSGSGPAYFFLLTEALETAAVQEGMSRDIASKLAKETLWGAAKIIKDTGRDPAELRKAVSSPGGTTLAALGVFDEAGFTDLVSKAVEAARKRAGELTQ